MADQFDTGAFVGSMCEKLRGGYSFMQALDEMGQELPEPTAGEVRQVVEAIGAGTDIETALTQFAVRNGEEAKLLVSATLIQREKGGALADVLESMEQVIRRSREMG